MEANQSQRSAADAARPSGAGATSRSSQTSSPQQPVARSTSGPIVPDAALLQQDRELLARVLAGDHGAFQTLFIERHGKMLSYLARELLGESGESDAIQTLFVRLFDDNARRLRSWDGSALFKTWLRRVATNLFADLKQRAGRETSGHEHLPEPSIDATPGTTIEASERREEVLELLEQLRNPRQRLIIELHYLEEKPLLEVARLINVSLSNVYVDHHRALAKLRELRANRGTHG